ncbi:hypothetical protein NC652_024205 [Populus alba x Populus x berolinensis]|nr:hypothetical protein NC652_024199 [Populus alba x Populus x berolinensis]KAJ6906720.1 hypothetical protein NC652_024205 [Populus alba x Populus x berolinensis]
MASSESVEARYFHCESEICLLKQKAQQESGGELSVAPQKPTVFRQFPQKKPIAERERSKPQLSKDVLAGMSHYFLYRAPRLLQIWMQGIGDKAACRR